jgi:hypothetical protein
MSDPSPSPTARFFGGALVVVGLLMMVLCGGCGALFFLGFLWSGLTSSNHEDVSMVVIPIIVGGIPAGIGLGLFIVGRALRRPQPRPPHG